VCDLGFGGVTEGRQDGVEGPFECFDVVLAFDQRRPERSANLVALPGVHDIQRARRVDGLTRGDGHPSCSERRCQADDDAADHVRCRHVAIVRSYGKRSVKIALCKIAWCKIAWCKIAW
jgi:hypothetical protein